MTTICPILYYILTENSLFHWLLFTFNATVDMSLLRREINIDLLKSINMQMMQWDTKKMNITYINTKF